MAVSSDSTMKYTDPIIEEIRAVRDAMAKECDYDIKKLAELIKSHEVQSGREVVRRPPRQPSVIQKPYRGLRDKQEI
jgi:hypothetical protein